jgi:hypothetical protein
MAQTKFLQYFDFPYCQIVFAHVFCKSISHVDRLVRCWDASDDLDLEVKAAKPGYTDRVQVGKGPVAERAAGLVWNVVTPITSSNVQPAASSTAARLSKAS